MSGAHHWWTSPLCRVLRTFILNPARRARHSLVELAWGAISGTAQGHRDRRPRLSAMGPAGDRPSRAIAMLVWQSTDSRVPSGALLSKLCPRDHLTSPQRGTLPAPGPRGSAAAPRRATGLGRTSTGMHASARPAQVSSARALDGGGDRVWGRAHPQWLFQPGTAPGVRQVPARRRSPDDRQVRPELDQVQWVLARLEGMSVEDWRAVAGLTRRAESDERLHEPWPRSASGASELVQAVCDLADAGAEAATQAGQVKEYAGATSAVLQIPISASGPRGQVEGTEASSSRRPRIGIPFVRWHGTSRARSP